MRPSNRPLHACVAILGCAVAFLSFHELGLAAAPGRNLIVHLENQFGLSESQVRGALGALLVYARERLPKPDFDDLAARLPNADMIMQEVQQQGIVSGPLDDLDEYEESLAKIGIPQATASQIPAAVVQYLGTSGFDRERDILARVLT